MKRNSFTKGIPKQNPRGYAKTTTITTYWNPRGKKKNTLMNQNNQVPKNQPKNGNKHG